MRTSRTTPRSTSAISAARSDRRNRTRLRDLCDEVLASFRAASSREVISEQDRRESAAILSRIAPLAR